MKGAAEQALQQVQSFPWISTVKTSQRNEETVWQVSVTDPVVAENQLLKLLVNGPVTVTEFRRKQYELEDVFMQVIEGGQNVGK
jgi:hypothetical protein